MNKGCFFIKIKNRGINKIMIFPFSKNIFEREKNSIKAAKTTFPFLLNRFKPARIICACEKK